MSGLLDRNMMISQYMLYRNFAELYSKKYMKFSINAYSFDNDIQI